MNWTLPARDGATGQTPYAPLRCTCGEPSPLHKLTTNGRRGACSRSTCKCEAFTDAKESTCA